MDQRPAVFLVASTRERLQTLERVMAGIDADICSYSSAEDFRRDHDLARPGCLVFNLDDASGIALHESLGNRHGMHPAIVISEHPNVPEAVTAVKHGVFDYLESPLRPERLLAAIREALAADAHWRQKTPQIQEIELRLESLTPREREIMNRVVQGLLSKQIANELGISPRTVEVHRAHVVKKMGVGSVAQLVRVVIEHRIVDRD
jgi:two-component system response regulator FixJ